MLVMISIIGGGPVGSYQAYLFAKQGRKVRVFEEHEKIGEPVKCTGIVTSSITDCLKLKDNFIVNKIKKAKIYAPNGKSITFDFKKEDVVVNRGKFDAYVADLAEKAGVEYLLGHRYKRNEGKKLVFNEKEYRTDYLIGADGPHSRVARHNKMWSRRKFLIGNQVTCELDVEDRDTMEVWLGLGKFSWCVPSEKGLARVGVVCEKDPKQKLDKLIEKCCPDAKIVSKETGTIPVFNPKQILQRNNVFLVGDAATQVKATSYGGIVPGMEAAKLLAKDMNFYSWNFKKGIGKELYLNNLIRKALDKFSEEEYNDLITKFNQKKLKGVLEKKSRDYPSSFALELLLREPRFFKYVFKLI